MQTIEIADSEIIRGDDLRYLAALPGLKRLILDRGRIYGKLEDLASAGALEELSISDKMVTAEGLYSLLALKRLKKLHIHPYHVSGDTLEPWFMLSLDHGTKAQAPASELDGCLRALRSLRELNAGIEIDDDTGALGWPKELLHPLIPPEYEAAERPALMLPWIEASFWTVPPTRQAELLKW